MTSLSVLLATVGLFLTIVLVALRVKTALLIGIALTMALGAALHHFMGVDIITPPSQQAGSGGIIALPSFETIGQGINVQVFSLLGPVTALLVIFSLMLTDFFDTMGSVIGVGEQAGFVTDEGELPGTERVLLVDSLAATVGGAFSASSVTTYIESGSGVAEGGRTGLTAVVTGVLFLVSIVLAPFVGIVPDEATAPALIMVGFLMCGVIRDIDFSDVTEGLPALFTMTLMPFTYSITNGIGAGFITYVFIAVVQGKAKQIHPLLWGIAIAFLIYFLIPYS
jgi:AGZA family xanthine/uracil permease-like MFS transporter